MARRIPWKYCECGCKSFVVTVGPLYFSYYDDLRGEVWFATVPNPYIFGKKVGSREEVDRLVREAVRKNKTETDAWAKEYLE
jgi:hypothetical protein